MTDDRDRRAAEEWWTHGLDLRDTTEACVESLAALLTAARAEGAAEAIEAAARVADTQAKHNLGMALDNPPDKEWCLDRALTAQVIRDAIRALAPAGLVAVSVDVDALVADLFTNGLGEEAERLVLVDARNRDLGGWCRTAVTDRIRAAVARKEG